MQALMLPYHSSLLGLFALAVLIVIQFLMVDVAMMRAKHVPGMPVTAGHGDFFFRANRAYGNTYEGLGLFLLITLLCLLSGADPQWTAYGVWLFTAARAAHMTCYYFDLRTARSTAFAFGLLAKLGLLVIAGRALF